MPTNDITIRINSDSSNAQRAFNKILRTVRELDKSVDRIGVTSSKTNKKWKDQEKEVDKLAQAYKRLNVAQSAVNTALNALRDSAEIVFAITRITDSIQLLSERMFILTGDAGQFNKIVKIGNNVGRTFQSIGIVSSRLALSIDELGASSDEINKVTEAVFQLARISGSTSRELEAGSLQLAQGLAAQRLAGDELRSVMENLPALAKELADGLGVGVQKLRDMGAAGELTGTAVFDVLLDRVDRINRVFQTLDKTTEQTFNIVKNEFTLLVNSIDKKIGASEFFRTFLDVLTEGARQLRFNIDPTSFNKIETITRQIADLRSNLRGFDPEDPANRFNIFKDSERAKLAQINRLEEERINIIEQQQKFSEAGDRRGRQNRRRQVAQRKEEARINHMLERRVEIAEQINQVYKNTLSPAQKIRLDLEKTIQFIKEARAAGIPQALGESGDNLIAGARSQAAEALAKLNKPQKDPNAQLKKSLNDRLAQFRTSQLNERELLQTQLSDRLKLFRDLRNLEQISEDEQNRLTLQARQDFQARLTEIDIREREKRLQAAEQERQAVLRIETQAFGIYAQTLAGFGELAAQSLGEGAAATKAIRLAEAIINTYAAANVALNTPEIFPGSNIVQAAGVIAFGLAQVARIRSTDVSGRASGGMVVGGKPYRVNEIKPEMFVDNFGRQFLLPSTAGEVTPLNQANNATSNVRIINNGPPLDVEGVRQRGDTTEIIVKQAVQAVRRDFQDSIASGHGAYASSIQGRYGVRRRV